MSAISAKVPPRWTVPARRQSGLVHPTSPSMAKSTLKADDPAR
ncbi:Uncharacterised protein [Mycobacterium tuberculosis]|nr:Uncharacterised protein [Mycobacterium tuberculosis]COZ97490.1 Uncharacterised protein [Mycobacterium tuberculosis]